MELRDIFKNGKVYIWKDIYAVIKSKNINPDAFANIVDKNEITLIIEQSKYDEDDVIEIENDWRMITFDVVLPFELVGFIAKISDALAKEDISIFVVSSYSTDHFLVKENDLPKTKEILENFGFLVDGG